MFNVDCIIVLFNDQYIIKSRKLYSVYLLLKIDVNRSLRNCVSLGYMMRVLLKVSTNFLNSPYKPFNKNNKYTCTHTKRQRKIINTLVINSNNDIWAVGEVFVTSNDAGAKTALNSGLSNALLA